MSRQGPGKRSWIRKMSDPSRRGSRLRHQDVQNYPMGSDCAQTQSRNPGPRSGNVGSDRIREASSSTPRTTRQRLMDCDPSRKVAIHFNGKTKPADVPSAISTHLHPRQPVGAIPSGRPTVPFRKAKGDAERSERRGMPGDGEGRPGFPRCAGEMSEGQRGRVSTTKPNNPTDRVFQHSLQTAHGSKTPHR